MGWYDDNVVPKLIDMGCGTGPISKQRAKVVPQAVGRVLEVGMGSGLNLDFYDPSKVELVFGLEPSNAIRKRAEPRLAKSKVKVEWLSLPGEKIPLDANSVDTVLLTYTLCTIPDFQTALAGMRRVLKPGGQLLFSEHGAAPDASVRKWQDRINPLWKKLAGGCNINREVPVALEDAGFAIQQLETMYLPGTPRIAAFQYWGYATEA